MNTSAAERRTNVLVLGLGNVLLGDDGVGPLALARLENDYTVPAPVRLVEGGTLGLALLDELASANHVILVDAVATGDTPGTLVRLDGAAVRDAVRERLSVHQVGVADLLDAARLLGSYPQTVVLLGLAPGRIGFGIERTPAVQAALDDLVVAVVREVGFRGYTLVDQTGTVSSAPARPIRSLVGHFGL